jgi:hypothetical protein
LQAPFKQGRLADRFDPPSTYAHVLHNTSCGDLAEFRALTGAWQTIYDCVRPNLIVLDHSPRAMIAARGYDVKRVPIGTGFCCPPDCYPLPDWRPWLKSDLGQLCRDEDRVLANVNEMLRERKQQPLERLGRLFSDVDGTLLTTFAELDHFPLRAGAEYWGSWSKGIGNSPQWPEVAGKRIFAYLKPFSGLAALLGVLRDMKLPTIVFSGGIDRRLAERFCGLSLRIEQSPRNIDEVSRQCDRAILNATHATTASMLLCGKPILMFPLTLEQRILAENVVALGAGKAVNPNRPEQFAAALHELLEADCYEAAAQRFAAKYADFDHGRQIARAVARLEELL